MLRSTFCEDSEDEVHRESSSVNGVDLDEKGRFLYLHTLKDEGQACHIVTLFNLFFILTSISHTIGFGLFFTKFVSIDD